MKKAHQLQRQLAKCIVFEDRLPGKIRFVCGVDAAYVNNLSIGAAVVLDYDSLKLVEFKIAQTKTEVPYIPTLLAFRELPPTILSVRKLETQPDVLLADGQGYAHPCRCGFASQLGLTLGKPTIGVAKSRLVGNIDRAKHGVALLKCGQEVVGAAVTTRRNSKPVYVSVGHMISLQTAIKIVRHCTRNHRVPEPILKAHEIATEEIRKINIM